MNQPKTPPRVSRELVEYLEGIYPDRCPSPGTEIEQIWRDAGAARVVQHLRSILNKELTSPVLEK